MKRKLYSILPCLALYAALASGAAFAADTAAALHVNNMEALLEPADEAPQGTPAPEQDAAGVNPFVYERLADEQAWLSSSSCLHPDSYAKMPVMSDSVTPLGSLYSGATATAALATAGEEVPVVLNPRVENFVRYFQTRGRKYFETWLDRSQNYSSMVKSTLRDYGLPEDLFYIAFIESGFSPTVKSRAKAVGMWQFIAGTAKKYGLRVDWWIDERRDPEKATVAAAKYFKNLYDQFGSWYLAAAGYNAGEGKVMRVMKKHNSDDYWALTSYKKGFKKETKEYVPKYLAAMLIAKDPAEYGFGEPESPEPNDAPAYDKVKISNATDLMVIAQAAGTTVEEIKKLNPELLHWFTPPDYPDYEIKLPAGTAQTFQENIGKIPPAQRVHFMKHKVRRGETVAKIAKRYGTAVKPILYLNNVTTAKAIRPGTTILIPVRAASAKPLGVNNPEVAVISWEFKG